MWSKDPYQLSWVDWLIIVCDCTLKPITPYSAFLVTSHCKLRRKDSLCTLMCGFCVSSKGGTGGGGWDHPQGAVHIVAVAARLGCERAMVGPGWATSCPDCMDKLRKHHSHLVGSWFLARKAAWALSRCMAIESADYCMLVNEWAWSKS